MLLSVARSRLLVCPGCPGNTLVWMRMAMLYVCEKEQQENLGYESSCVLQQVLPEFIRPTHLLIERNIIWGDVPPKRNKQLASSCAGDHCKILGPGQL